jgi:hypothetical protein
MTKSLNFAEKVAKKDNEVKKESVVIKHIIKKESVNKNTTHFIIRINKDINYRLDIIKANYIINTGEQFFIKSYFIRLLEIIVEEFKKGNIAKNKERFYSKTGSKQEDKYNLFKKSLTIPISLKAELKKGQLAIEKEAKRKLCLNTIINYYLEKDIITMEKEYGFIK